MGNDINDSYIKIHNQMADKNGLNVKALWGSKESQEKRFEILEKLFLTKSNFSVIDYGCGLAHFYEYLLAKGYSNIKYFGVDINERFVNEVNLKCSNIEIIHGGAEKVQEILLREEIDYVISSGIYNLGDSENKVQSVFLDNYSNFYKSIKVGCGINFLSYLSSKKDNQSIYHNPYTLLETCEKHISKNIVYFHNYLPHDFTILIYKYDN